MDISVAPQSANWRKREPWPKLSGGSTAIVSIAPSQWAPLYGMLRDSFGVTWVVDVVAQYDAA